LHTDLARVFHEIVEHALLDRRRVLHANHHLGEHVFVDSGRREEIGRADFAQVVGNRGRVLGAADAKAGDEGLRVGKQVVADPGHRQVGEHLLVGGQALANDAVARGDDRVVVGQHHALGIAGGARGVKHDADFAAVAGGDFAVVVVGVLAVECLARLLDRLEVVQELLAVLFETAGIVVDDMLDMRTAVEYFEHLVDLLLVLDQRDLDVGIVEHVGHFVGHRILVKRHRHRAERLRRGHAPVESRAVVADDRQLFAALEPEAGESAGERADFDGHLGPGPGLPDTEVLLAHRVAIRALLDVALQQLRKGVERRVLCLLAHRIVNNPPGPVRFRGRICRYLFNIVDNLRDYGTFTWTCCICLGWSRPVPAAVLARLVLQP